MKKIWTLIVGIVLAFGIVGCGAEFAQKGELSSIDAPALEKENDEEYFSDFQGYYFLTDNENVMLIDSNGALIILSNQSGDEKLFDGLTNGDIISVTLDAIAETYPMEAGCYSCTKQRDGTIEDIPEDALRELNELGWLCENQSVEITAVELTKQQVREYEEQGIVTLGSEDGTYKSYFLVSFNQVITELSLWKIEMDVIFNENFIGRETECIGSVQSLTPNQQVIIVGDIGEMLPTLGISYITDTGVKAHDYLTINGKDGTLMLVEYEIAENE